MKKIIVVTLALTAIFQNKGSFPILAGAATGFIVAKTLSSKPVENLTKNRSEFYGYTLKATLGALSGFGATLISARVCKNKADFTLFYLSGLPTFMGQTLIHQRNQLIKEKEGKIREIENNNKTYEPQKKSLEKLLPWLRKETKTPQRLNVEIEKIVSNPSEK